MSICIYGFRTGCYSNVYSDDNFSYYNVLIYRKLYRQKKWPARNAADYRQSSLYQKMITQEFSNNPIARMNFVGSKFTRMNIFKMFYQNN